MTEIFRTRDCVVFSRGDSYTVDVSENMTQNGWVGGQAVKWTDSSVDGFKVTYSDGLYGGFFLWGSDEPSDQYVSFLKNQLVYGFGVLCLGGWLISTTTYEKYTYASRQAGPLVPIVYTEGVRLRFSLRGYFTIEDEWQESLDIRRPNGYFIGSVTQAPKQSNSFYLGVQTSI